MNTRHILFIVSGAFVGLKAIVAKRLNSGRIGFTRAGETSSTVDTLPDLTTQDFIDFGFEPEFIGRLPVRVSCQELDEEALFSILKNSEASVIQQYVFAFSAYGIDLSFSDEALRAIAKKAAQEKTGARGLMTILEGLLRDFKYYLPSTNILEFVVSPELIAEPKAFLEGLLQTLQEDQRAEIKLIKEFEKRFAEAHGMKIAFDTAAVQQLIRRAKTEGIPVDELCEKILQSFEHGLKLIKQNTGKDAFVISEEIVKHPRQSLEKMVKESYNLKAEEI